MKFIKENYNTEKYVDNIFAVSTLAKADINPETINASIGSFYDEEGKLLAYKNVFENERKLTDIQRASYAGGAEGNKEYNTEICKFVLEDYVKIPYQCVATPGGTGAISLSLMLCLNKDDTILMPNIGWGNYKNMTETFGLKRVTYDIYDLDDLEKKVSEVKGKVVLIINSPCENPCGLSYSKEEWKRVLTFLNSLNKEVVLINDIAYIDYAYQNPKEYFSLFNEISKQVLVLLAYSCSKAFSYYGERLGALIGICKEQETLDEFMNLATKQARTTWSNVNNGAMINISQVIKNHLEEYQKEKTEAVSLLKKRSDLFLEEANEVGLQFYPYQEGFFFTLKFDNNEIRDQVHKVFLENHLYTIKVNLGIRIGLCAVPLNKIKGLAKKIKDMIEIVIK